MLPLSIRGLPGRLASLSKLQTASYVITRRSREVARSHEFTRDDAEAANDSSNDMGMDHITDILDNAAKPPQSDNFTSVLLFVSTTFFTHLSSSLP
jgi:hypothetical protein